MGRLVLFAWLGIVVWLVRPGSRKGVGVSAAVWIPMVWAGVELSRPLSFWLGVGGGSSTLEGSPLDSLVYAGLIFGAILVLKRRRLNWSAVIHANWPIFLFYGYLLLTVVWS